VEALAARYGAAVVRAAVAELMDRAELRMRRAIGALPDGQYSYEAHLESQGRADMATVYGEALAHPDWCPIQPQDCWTELPDARWNPLQRAVMLMACHGPQPFSPSVGAARKVYALFDAAGKLEQSTPEDFNRLAAVPRLNRSIAAPL
jgi:hypothetical protein